MHNAAGQRRCFEHWHICLPHIPRDNKASKRAKARTMNQILVNTIIISEGKQNQTSHLTYCGYQDTLENAINLMNYYSVRLICIIVLLLTASGLFAQSQRYIKKGLKAESEQQYSKAIKHFTKTIKKDPQNFQGYFHRGRMKHIQNDLEGAISDYTLAVEKTEKEKNSIYFNRALAKLDMGDYKGAIEDNTLALKLKSKKPEALLNRGIAYSFVKNYKYAVRDFSAALTINPNNPKIYDSRAFALDNLGDLEQAKQDYLKAMELNPKLNRYLDIGIIYDKLGDYENALMAFSKCIAINKHDTVAFFNRSQVKFMLKDIDGALSDISEVIRMDSSFASAHYHKGYLNYSSGNYKQAISDFSKAIELNPQDEYSYYNRGNTWAKLNDYGKAIVDYSTAIDMLPLEVAHYPSAKEMEVAFYYDRSVAKHVQGDNKGAIKDISVALEKNPLDDKAYSQRAYYQFVLKLYDKAVVDIRRAIELDSGNVDHTQVFAQILLASGQYDSALQISINALGHVSDADIRAKSIMLFVICASGKILDKNINSYESELNRCLAQDFVFPSILSFNHFRDSFKNEQFSKSTQEYLQNIVNKLEQKIKLI